MVFFFFFPLQYIHSFIDGHVCVDEERSRPVQRGHFGGHWLRVRYSVPRGEGDLCAVCSGVVSEYFVQSRWLNALSDKSAFHFNFVPPHSTWADLFVCVVKEWSLLSRNNPERRVITNNALVIVVLLLNRIMQVTLCSPLQVWWSSSALGWPSHHIYRLLYPAPLGEPVSKNSMGRWGILLYSWDTMAPFRISLKHFFHVNPGRLLKYY